ncbi:hypothetical protein [Alteriqipengyuania lutimaris]|uniref:hypothetical protein n=1 Tax=Alteriqipengyuania lutimaris TaxID=1538146 RepID=UPI0015F153D8|nr:hypothetical protein [Alteriqipengyuania lutimaris]MBB3032710.1 hypothetical protein [Alteriqipengyuania lutimaris]
MHEQAHPKRHAVGKAVLVTILAAGTLVALNPLPADGAQIDGPIMIQVTEIA